jgi:hypothetical protein
MLHVVRFLCGPLCLLGVFVGSASADPPVAGYLFPAGGQRGTTVQVRVGGLFLHEKCNFALGGKGLAASPVLTRTRSLWFEGPVLPLPESQQQEDYPVDMAGTVGIAKEAPLGPRRGWVCTSQGGAGGLVFVVGDLPEVVEHETDGDPIPERLTLPVTANGRIFPRDDVDLWEFEAAARQTVTALVLAARLNSPLEPQLEMLDATGRVLAETMTHPVVGADASVRFTAPVAGKYRVRVRDARGQGGPAYVYRLTVTTAAVADFTFPLQVPADGLVDVTAAKDLAPAPIALNGRIARPGAVDEWRVGLKKGTKYTLDLQARGFGSPLFGVVTVTDPAGKELARAEAGGPTPDPSLTVQAPADGAYTVRVSERFRTRGGPNFVYRLKITDGTGVPAGFRLTLIGDGRQTPPPDAYTVLRGANLKLRITAERMGGFSGPIEVTVANLPKGVTAKPMVIAANQTTGELTLQADSTAPIGTAPLTVTGTAATGLALLAVAGPASVGREPVRVTASVPGTRFLPETVTPYLTVGLPTPFRLVDEYVMTSAPRGEVYRRTYRVERDPGFDGPIEVRLADRQARHLQGVTGPVVVVPPGKTVFEYPATLPPWMELGRTCRVCVMATGRVKDVDGTEHPVVFTSTGINQQMIVVVGPGRLDLALDRLTVRSAPGSEVRVPVRVARSRDLSGPVTVEAILPSHWRGVSASPVVIPPGATTGELVLRFAVGEVGPFNMPLTVRATLTTPSTPVIAEAKLEIVDR